MNENVKPAYTFTSESVTEGHPDIEGRITERTDPDQEPDF